METSNRIDSFNSDTKKFILWKTGSNLSENLKIYQKNCILGRTMCKKHSSFENLTCKLNRSFYIQDT